MSNIWLIWRLFNLRKKIWFTNMSVYENFTKCLCLFIYEKKSVDQGMSNVKYFTYLTVIYFTSKNNILRIIVVNSCLFWHQFINYYKKQNIQHKIGCSFNPNMNFDVFTCYIITNFLAKENLIISWYCNLINIFLI